MKQQRNSCFSSRVACMALALCGLGGFLGLGSTGAALASAPTLSQSIEADYTTSANRGTTERKCPRSTDGCEKPQSCKPGILVCRVVSGE
jgi:hypothetical protein